MTKEKKTPAPQQIDAELYAEIQQAAADYKAGDRQRLSNILYTVMQALYQSDLSIFMAAADTDEETQTNSLCSGAYGQPLVLGTITGFQLGQVLRDYKADEARSILDAFIYGLESTAPMIEASVESIIRKKRS